MNSERFGRKKREEFTEGLRKYVSKRPPLMKIARAVSFTGRLGPWRGLMIRGIRRFSKNPPILTKSDSLFPELDVWRTAAAVDTRGYSLGINLPAEYAEKIAGCSDFSQPKMYLNPHKKCPLVEAVALDPKVVAIARQYLGIEPVLWGSRLYWTMPASTPFPAPQERMPKKGFHYDVGDFKSLSLFFYLTDVDGDCGPHVLIENTHGRKTFRQMFNPYLTAEKAEQIYGDRIKVLTGRRGTGFFEDLTSFHQHSTGIKPRLVLTISYLLHRQPLH